MITTEEKIQVLEEATDEILEAANAELKSSASKAPQLLDTLLQIFSARRQSELVHPGNRSEHWQQQTAKLKEGIIVLGAVVTTELEAKYSNARASIRRRALEQFRNDEDLQKLRRECKTVQAQLADDLRRLGPLATDALRELEDGLGEDALSIVRGINTDGETDVVKFIMRRLRRLFQL